MAVDGRYIFIVFDVLIAIGCCLGNLLVIWAVWKSGALNQPTFCLIVSLAMADFLVGCVVVPLSVVEVLNIEMSFHACLFINCVLIVPLQASLLTLLAIALDRYLRVCIPFRYKSTVTKRRSWVLAAVCWMLACLLGFLPMYGWNKPHTLKRHNSTLNCEFTAVISFSYLVNFIFFGTFIPLLAIMVALYCYIFFKVRRLKGKTGIAESGAYNHKEHNLAGSLVLVLALCVACWLPLHIMHAIHFYFQSIRVPSDVIYFGVVVSHANSVVNPVVYALKIPKIKAEFRKVWRSLIGPQQQTTESLDL
nr:adenosine receptor A3-like [Misgurnus anguillicaudatus]